jgi:type IV pilus assembly protein PilV
MKSSVHINSLNRASIRSRARGFTLLEVMVALVITSIGLLGIAKMQTVAYASTNSASLRSLVALQAAGLASSMHANRNYWSTGLASPITINVTTITGDAALSAVVSCLNPTGATPAAYCSNTQMAAFDLQTYAQALNSASMLLNLNPVTTITCPTGFNPVSCTIQVTWNEHSVSINNQGVAGTVQTTGTTPGTFAPSYTLYVDP